MSGFMNPAEFANIRQSEEDFWWYRGLRATLFRMLEPHLKGRAISRALEAGCGTGYLSHILQRERGWPIVPLDFSRDGLRFARQLGVRNPVQGDIRSLPFGDGAFDLVMSVDVIAHLPRRQMFVAARQVRDHVHRHHQVEGAVAERQGTNVALHRVPHPELAREAQAIAAEIERHNRPPALALQYVREVAGAAAGLQRARDRAPLQVRLQHAE